MSLDEAHTPHICGKIVNPARTLTNGARPVFVLQIANNALDVSELLVPLMRWLYINCTDALVTIFVEITDKMAADKTTGTSNDDQVVRVQLMNSITAV